MVNLYQCCVSPNPIKDAFCLFVTGACDFCSGQSTLCSAHNTSNEDMRPVPCHIQPATCMGIEMLHLTSVWAISKVLDMPTYTPGLLPAVNFGSQQIYCCYHEYQDQHLQQQAWVARWKPDLPSKGFAWLPSMVRPLNCTGCSWLSRRRGKG